MQRRRPTSQHFETHAVKRARRLTGVPQLNQQQSLSAYREKTRLEWLQQNMGVPVLIGFVEDAFDARNIIKLRLGALTTDALDNKPLAKGAYNEVFVSLKNPKHIVRLNIHAYGSTAEFFDELVMYSKLNKMTPQITPRLIDVCIVRTYTGIFVGTTIERIEICDSMFKCSAYTDTQPTSDEVIVSRYIYDMLCLASTAIKAKIYHGDVHFGNIAITPTSLMLIDFDRRSCFVGAEPRERGCGPTTMMGSNPNNFNYAAIEYVLANYNKMTNFLERTTTVLCTSKLAVMMSILIYNDQVTHFGLECPQFRMDDLISAVMMSPSYERLAPAKGIVMHGNNETRMSATDVVALREIAGKMNMAMHAMCDGTEVRPCYEQSTVYIYAAAALNEVLFNWWTAIETEPVITYNTLLEVVFGIIDYGVLALLTWCLHPVQTMRPTLAQLDRALNMMRNQNTMLQWRDPSLLERLKSMVTTPPPSVIQNNAVRLDFCV